MQPGQRSCKAGAKDTMSIKRILVVEDEVEIRLLLTEVLGDAGFDVAEAKDGDHAIRMLDGSASFDLVVTDISMPGTADGNMVAARAKTLDPQIPVVYVSWTLALFDGWRSCVRPQEAGSFVFESDALHGSRGHGGAIDAN